jgi:HlyD family secretion protein
VALALPIVLGLGCAGDSGDLVLVGSVERTLVELTAPAYEEITEIPVGVGARVARGQVCVRFHTALAAAEVAGAEASVARARAEASVAAQEHARVSELHRRRIASEKDLERALGERDAADARLRETQALLAAAGERMRDLTVVSPTDGVVDQLPFDVGERPPVGGVVTVILEDAAPWVRVWVPQRAVAIVGPGTPAEIRIDGVARPLGGHVRDVAREPAFTPHYALTERERVHLVYETRVTIDDAPPSLRPGAPAEVVLRPESVPSRAGADTTPAAAGAADIPEGSR